MLAGAKNRRALGSVVAANSLEDARAVVEGMGKHVYPRFVPGNHRSVMPDLVGCLNHALYLLPMYPLCYGIEAESGNLAAERGLSRQLETSAASSAAMMWFSSGCRQLSRAG